MGSTEELLAREDIEYRQALPNVGPWNLPHCSLRSFFSCISCTSYRKSHAVIETQLSSSASLSNNMMARWVSHARENVVSLPHITACTYNIWYWLVQIYIYIYIYISPTNAVRNISARSEYLISYCPPWPVKVGEMTSVFLPASGCLVPKLVSTNQWQGSSMFLNNIQAFSKRGRKTQLYNYY